MNHASNVMGYVVICFQISIFEPLKTAASLIDVILFKLWFAFKLVSLNHWKQLRSMLALPRQVVICFQISIFEPLKTALIQAEEADAVLWFAFKLVSLNHWKQLRSWITWQLCVVICFQISIFEPLKTATKLNNLTALCCDLLSN